MNNLKDLIEVTGNLVEEAWNCGRKEALRETGRKDPDEKAQDLVDEIEDLHREIEELRKENHKLRAVAQELLGGGKGGR